MKTFKKLSNDYWRVCATGLSFILFAIGALILGYIITPIHWLIVRDANRRALRNQQMIHITFRLFVFMLTLFKLVDFEFNHIDKLQNNEGVLIISNHPTLIDYVVIVSKLKHCKTLVKEDLFKNFFTRRIVKSAHYIPNEKSLSTFELIQQGLKAGDNVLLFPEGTRTVPQQPLQLQRGAAHIALRVGVPVRLVHIHISHATLTKHAKWYHIPSQKAFYRLHVGELVDPLPFLQKAGSLPLAARQLTRYFSEQLTQGMTYEPT